MNKMKKIILLLAIVSLLPLTGCVNAAKRRSMIGWEYVRIERSVPHKDCKYVIQSTCSNRGSKCYEKFKKDAKIFGANTVVMTEDIRSWKEGSSMATGTWSGNEISTAIADFYDCPKYEIRQNAAPTDIRKSTNKSDITVRVQ